MDAIFKKVANGNNSDTRIVSKKNIPNKAQKNRKKAKTLQCSQDPSNTDEPVAQSKSSEDNSPGTKSGTGASS